jgi:hypothetical protein
LFCKLIFFSLIQDFSKKCDSSTFFFTFNIVYAAIAGVVLFVLALALAGRRVKVERAWWQRFDRFVSFAAVVMLVEFAILFLDPWLDRFTGGAPLWRMAANVCIAVVVTPLHGLVEARLRASAGETAENEV